MNRQFGGVTTNNGTWYEFHVVNSDTLPGYINEKIHALKKVSLVEYSNYKKDDALLDYIEQLIKKMDNMDAIDSGMLESYRKRKAVFEEVDRFKEELKEIAGDQWEEEDRELLAEIIKTYDGFTEEQQSCMTYAESSKLILIRRWLMNTPASQGITGDANGDGIVNAKDALRILRYRAGYSVEIDTELADFNEDGVVNAKDAAALLRMLAEQ